MAAMTRRECRAGSVREEYQYGTVRFRTVPVL